MRARPSPSSIRTRENTMQAGNHLIHTERSQRLRLVQRSGFAVCQECHADKFIGGISNVTCLNTAGCHGASVSAPHSPKPWRGGTRTHTNTDQSNAPICALCHTNGANSSVQPSTFDSGAAPGCFNNTLCHCNRRTPGRMGASVCPRHKCEVSTNLHSWLQLLSDLSRK